MTGQELITLVKAADKSTQELLREWLNDNADIHCECGMEGSEGARCIICFTIAKAH